MSRPLECIEMDIKNVWIPEKGKNAYLLTLLDVHTRKVLNYRLAWNIKQKQVIATCAELDVIFLPKTSLGIEILDRSFE